MIQKIVKKSSKQDWGPLYQSFFLDPLARAAALGFLDRQSEASAAVAELRQLVPDFERHGRDTLRRIFRYEQPVKLMYE